MWDQWDAGAKGALARIAEAVAPTLGKAFPPSNTRGGLPKVIERLGAFASGATRHTGPKRWMAVFLVLLILIPLAIEIVFSLVHMLTG